MREVGAFGAKNKRGDLRDVAERGDDVTITRHGKEVARVVPPKGVVNREAARGIREMSKGVTLGGLTIKDLIDEGRR